MKLITPFNTITAAFLIVCISACEPSKKQEDSVEVAKEINDESFEDRDDEKDADFVVNTVAANYAEIKFAQLALNKSTNPAVKKMATTLEADHRKILDDMKAYAGKNGIAVPMSESEDASKDIEKLAEKDADEFDEKWFDMLEDKHKKTIDKFEARIDKTEDVELKNLISATLPGLKSHLEMIEDHDH